MSTKPAREGLSLWYRFTWRVKYTVLTFYGPPRLSGRQDPLTRLEMERASKVAEARAAGRGDGSSETR